MNGGGTLPIAIASAAMVCLVVWALANRRRPSTSIWFVLAVVAVVPAAGSYWALRFVRENDSASLRQLTIAALATVSVMSMGALALGFRARSHMAQGFPAPVASRALWVGLAAVAAVSVLWRGDRSVMVAGLPASIGVLSITLGSRAFRAEQKPSRASSRASFDVLCSACLSLGSIACAAIAAGATALGQQPDAPSHALRALARSSAFGIAPALSAAVVLASRLAQVGRGAIGHLAQLAALCAVLFVGAGSLRLELAWAIGGPGRTAKPAGANDKPAPAATAADPRVALASSVADEQPPPAEPDAARPSEAPSAAGGAMVSFGKVRVSGMLAPAEVQRVLERVRPRIEQCHARATDPGRDGEIVVRFAIGSNGSVTAVQDDGHTTLTNKKFVGCVLSSFYQIGFPAPTRGNVRVEAPIYIRQP